MKLELIFKYTKWGLTLLTQQNKKKKEKKGFFQRVIPQLEIPLSSSS